LIVYKGDFGADFGTGDWYNTNQFRNLVELDSLGWYELTTGVDLYFNNIEPNQINQSGYTSIVLAAGSDEDEYIHQFDFNEQYDVRSFALIITEPDAVTTNLTFGIAVDIAERPEGKGTWLQGMHAFFR